MNTSRLDSRLAFHFWRKKLKKKGKIMNDATSTYQSLPQDWWRNWIPGGVIETFCSYAEIAFCLWATGAVITLIACFLWAQKKGGRASTSQLLKIVILWPLVFFLE